MENKIKPKVADTPLKSLEGLKIWAARGKSAQNPETGKFDRAPINPATGGNASNQNPATWGTRAKAEERAARYAPENQPGVGLMLGADHAPKGFRRGGIDADSCRDPLTGKIESWAEKIVWRFDTYTEASPSGGGLHLIFYVRETDVEALRAERLLENLGRTFAEGEHVEIATFFGGKFLTVTDDVHDDELFGEFSLVRVVSLDDLRWLLGEFGPAWASKSGGASSSNADDTGSGHGYRLVMDLIREGLDDDAVAKVLSADDGEAGEWWNRADSRQRRRALENAHKRVEKEEAELIAALDDLSEEEDGETGDRPKAPRYPPDQDGAIRAFTDRHRDRLRYVHDRRSWFHFEGNTWQPERTALAKDLARDECMALARPHGREGKGLRYKNVWDAVESGAQADRAFAAVSTEWDGDPMLLGTPEGVVDLSTGEIRGGRPEDMVSKRTAVHPVALDAFYDELECPLWSRFLEEALGGDPEAVRFLAQWAGMSLTGDTSEQKLLFIHGGGGNGKGVTINTLARVAGDYAADVPARTLTAQKYEDHPTEMARLHGVRFAHASEVERNAKWADARIKSMTGGDPITARFMRGDFFTFQPQLTLTVVGNDRPSFGKIDDALRRRFLLLEMDRKPERPDPDLPEKLWQEAPGILSWMIQGALDWQRNGLVIPEAVRRSTDDYFTEEDHFARFLADCGEPTRGGRAATKDLMEAYDLWSAEESDAPFMSERELAQEMKRRGFTPMPKVKRQNGLRGNGYEGFQLNVEVAQDQ